MKLRLLLACTILVSWAAYAQEPLTVDYIMRDPKWMGSQPSDLEWSVDGQTLYFSWDPDGDDTSDTYAFSPGKDTQPQKLSKEEAKQRPDAEGEYNQDRSLLTYTREGDLYTYHLPTKEETRHTNTLARESSPRFNQAGTHLVYELENNLYTLELKSGLVTQLTDMRRDNEPRERSESAQDRWLAADNAALIDYVADQQRDNSNDDQESTRPAPVYLGGQSAFSLQLSPDERYITFVKGSFGGGKNTEMPNYLAASGYVEMERARPKVGSPEGTLTLWVYDREKRTAYPIKTDDLPGLHDVPAYYAEYNRTPELHTRDISFSYQGITWSPDGQYAVSQITANDNKDRWIVQLDLAEGNIKVLDRQHDDAWIAGPGVGWFSGGILGWIPNSSKLWFVSEASGYAHLHTVDLKNGKTKALTEGKFEVYEPEIGPNDEYFYFAANVEHPGIRHVYRMPIKGGALEQLTTLKGGHEFDLSPNGQYLAYRYSSATRPWQLYFQATEAGAQPQQITKGISQEFKDYAWRTPEYVSFTARDGAEVYARLYKPENAQPGGPAVVFVHGAGYLQNAHQWWSSYFREYMFHNLLVEKGYTVLDMDYRASAGYGRDWRTGIYRHMGGKDLTDQVDGANWLVSDHGIDANRIGIYGGSYGGFITLMALFNESETFACGAALRSVTDWAHYNHGYTSVILNTPVLDSMAYRRSSPIYYANGLNKPLLMCHGMLDDNVQFQDIVRLSQIFIEQGKENWELAVFPAEPHGFRRPDSWTDEYKRILKLFETHLKP